MNGKRAKDFRRKARRLQGKIIAESVKETLSEPWPKRFKTGVYIATGGRMWVATVVTWLFVLFVAINSWQAWRWIH